MRSSGALLHVTTAGAGTMLRPSGANNCHFRPNDIIYVEGDEARYSYKVVSGTVRLVKLMADGRRNVASFELSGDTFGLERLDEHVYSAEAVTDVVATRFARSRTEQIGEGHDETLKESVACLLRELDEARKHIVTLACRSARERVALFLHFFANRAGTQDGESVELPMGREDMADYLGLTVETVCRNLRGLKSGGVIAIPSPQQIVVLNSRALRTIAAVEN